MYRIEVWINNSHDVNNKKHMEEIGELKEFLRKTLGSEVEDKPIM